MTRAVLATLALVCPARAAFAQELTAGSLERWRDYVLPAEDELAWLDVPWRTTLWAAVEEGHALEKPILLWAMNGHPLGCT